MSDAQRLMISDQVPYPRRLIGFKLNFPEIPVDRSAVFRLTVLGTSLPVAVLSTARWAHTEAEIYLGRASGCLPYLDPKMKDAFFGCQGVDVPAETSVELWVEPILDEGVRTELLWTFDRRFDKLLA